METSQWECWPSQTELMRVHVQSQVIALSRRVWDHCQCDYWTYSSRRGWKPYADCVYLNHTVHLCSLVFIRTQSKAWEWGYTFQAFSSHRDTLMILLVSTRPTMLWVHLVYRPRSVLLCTNRSGQRDSRLQTESVSRIFSSSPWINAFLTPPSSLSAALMVPFAPMTFTSSSVGYSHVSNISDWWSVPRVLPCLAALHGLKLQLWMASVS